MVSSHSAGKPSRAGRLPSRATPPTVPEGTPASSAVVPLAPSAATSARAVNAASRVRTTTCDGLLSISRICVFSCRVTPASTARSTRKASSFVRCVR